MQILSSNVINNLCTDKNITYCRCNIITLLGHGGSIL